MKDNKLWYNKSAQIWEQALPIGNGRLGGMVFGGTKSETIHLNEDTLWSGYPKDTNDYNAFNYLEKIRKLVLDKKYAEAQAQIKEHMLCDFNESYEPMANLNIELMGSDGIISDFKRELDLNTAVCKTEYISDGVRYKKTYFASAPDNAVICRYESDSKSKISLNVTMESQLQYSVKANSNLLILSGKCPSHTDPNYLPSENPVIYDSDENNRAMLFEVRLFVQNEGGNVYSDGDKIIVENADSVNFYVVAQTSFNGYDKNPATEGKNYSQLCENDLSSLKSKTFEQILLDHIKDYQSLFNRVEFELPNTNISCLPTNERLQKASEGELDPDLATLLFHFGRYVMISSSRPNTQPANLQGIWNSIIRPPWSSNLTTNINAEMNYWPVETCNLSECHTPLFDAIDELKENGKTTAKVHYGCSGWVSHHNVDIWRQSSPVGKPEAGNYAPTYAFWPMSSGWLCRHIWEHYLFTLDMDFLKSKYSIMKDAALFYCDWLITDKDGRLTTCPSTSPENNFIAPNGDVCSVSCGSTMDLSIIKELFENCIRACEILNTDMEFANILNQKLEKINPFRIGKYGQLQEWNEDFEENDINHRHVSHLYGLYPSSLITPDSTPELANAAINSLDRRGDAGTGWSLAWKVNLWARLKNSERALSLVKQGLTPALKTDIDYRNGGGTLPNMFGAHPPFQIDSNFGMTSGIAEMLMQSHTGTVEILPALPKEWNSGFVRGLRARGGFEVSIKWENGIVCEICIKALTDCVLRLKYKEKVVKLQTKKNSTYTFNENLILI